MMALPTPALREACDRLLALMRQRRDEAAHASHNEAVRPGGSPTRAQYHAGRADAYERDAVNFAALMKKYGLTERKDP